MDSVPVASVYETSIHLLKIELTSVLKNLSIFNKLKIELTSVFQFSIFNNTMFLLFFLFFKQHSLVLKLKTVSYKIKN